MNTAAIREQLYDYIRVADEKKIRAIYMMLEDDIVEEKEWWKDNILMEELDRRYTAWESGGEKGFTLSDIDTSIAQLKKKRVHR
ncbi:hypothetical protein [Taibaiella koreensis]|uniref:hypothetical protein n=1 Tax=Taibaiella koreensis TaxID=1268548 RepID=UPI000E5A0C58|nr:hypothetical protein [Taibaiella koreensis]